MYYVLKYSDVCMYVHRWDYLMVEVCKMLLLLPQVMDKYGEFYGRDRISELLGMDKAALDFSDAREKKKPKKDSSLSAVWVLILLYSRCR